MQLSDSGPVEPALESPSVCGESAKEVAAEQDLDIRLSSPQGIPEAERIVRSRISPTIVEEIPPPRSGQFSIASAMILLFFLCLGLSGASWVPAPVFAGIIGISLMLVIFSAITSPGDTVLSVTVWMGIILAYVIACGVALLQWSR